jgi:hypothetical protein
MKHAKEAVEREKNRKGSVEDCNDEEEENVVNMAVVYNVIGTSTCCQQIQEPVVIAEDLLPVTQSVHTFASDELSTTTSSVCEVLADNQATVSVFGNADLLTNIRLADNAITVEGIGGKTDLNLVGDFDLFGEVYYSPNIKSNILCFADLDDRFDMKYVKESGKKIFRCDLNDGRRIDFCQKGKLFMYDAMMNVTDTMKGSKGSGVSMFHESPA